MVAYAEPVSSMFEITGYKVMGLGKNNREYYSMCIYSYDTCMENQPVFGTVRAIMNRTPLLYDAQ